MTTVTIELEDFTAALQAELGEVALVPGFSPTGNSDPQTLPTTPSVMMDFELVPSAKYRFEYNNTRYLKLGYVLQRDTLFESGELEILSDAVRFEGEAPPEYSEPNLIIDQIVRQQTAATGVELSVISDPATFPSRPSFGVAYKITSSTPAVFPKLRMFVIKLMPLKPETSNAPTGI